MFYLNHWCRWRSDKIFKKSLEFRLYSLLEFEREKNRSIVCFSCHDRILWKCHIQFIKTIWYHMLEHSLLESSTWWRSVLYIYICIINLYDICIYIHIYICIFWVCTRTLCNTLDWLITDSWKLWNWETFCIWSIHQ